MHLCGLAQRNRYLEPRSLGFAALPSPGPMAGIEDLCPTQSNSDTGSGSLMCLLCHPVLLGKMSLEVNSKMILERGPLFQSAVTQPRSLGRCHCLGILQARSHAPAPFQFQMPSFDFLCLLDVFIIEDILMKKKKR